MTDTTSQPEFLTVKELAELLRLKERKVYDLAASGQVPCSRATGKLLFPADEVRAWIAENKSGPTGTEKRAAVFLGSHDPLLDWALRESRAGFATMFDSSLDGLKRFVAGEGMAAGLHIHEKDDHWNRRSVAAAASGLDAVLVRWATRRRGLVLRPEMVGKIGGISDLPGLSLARRQPEAGAEVLFRHLLENARVEPQTLKVSQPFRSEQDAVQAIAQGEADVTFGLEAVAAPYGLGFVPVIDEHFDLLVDRRSWFEAPMQTLFAFAQSDRFQDQAAKFTGYNMSDLGNTVWNS